MKLKYFFIILILFCPNAEAKFYPAIKNLDRAGVGVSSDITIATDDNFILKYDLATATWGTEADATGAGANISVLESGVLSSSTVASIDLTAAFDVTMMGSRARISLDLTEVTSAEGPLTIAGGGTAASTHTDGGVLIGKGTAAFANTGVLGDGTIIIGDGVTNPTTLAAFSSSTGTLSAAQFPILAGDVTTPGASLTTTIAPNSVALTTDTTGNYAAGDAEAGAALTGDSATSFFSTGTLEVGIGGTGVTSISNDAILVGNPGGTGFDRPVIADSDGATQKLQYDQTNGVFSAGTDDDIPEAADYSNLSGGNAINVAVVGTVSWDTVTVSQDALSAVVSSPSGFQTISGRATLLQGCAASQVLQWNETADIWECATASGTDTNAVKEYWWPASATLPLEVAADSIPPISKVAGTNVDELTVNFDSATDECRTVSFKVPSDVQSGSTITFRTHWKTTIASADANVVWDFRSTVGASNGVSNDTTLAVDSTTAAAQTPIGRLTVTTWTQTLANLGWAANEQVDGEFCRDANNAADTASFDSLATGFGIEIPRA